MHVALDARTATPAFPGIGRYVQNLLRVLPSALEEDERLTVLRAPTGAPPGPVIKSSVFGLQQQWEVRRVLKKHRATVYHSPYYAMPYFPGVPTVVTIHDIIPMVLPAQVAPRVRRLFPFLLRRAMHTAEHFIADSAHTRDDLCQYLGLAPERITVVPLAPEPHFRPADEEEVAAVRRRLNLPPRYVLYVGSNKPHKNLVRLLDAWAMVAAEQVLVIAGVWDERYPEARQAVEKQELSDRVRFLGPVTEADLPALYTGTDLFVFPSIYEGFGFPVIEAMACGAPVVCSHAASLPEVGGTAARYVDPYDVGAMAAAIGEVLADDALRRQMQQASLSQATRFSWEETARRTAAVYRSVA